MKKFTKEWLHKTEKDILFFWSYEAVRLWRFSPYAFAATKYGGKREKVFAGFPDKMTAANGL